MSVTLLSHVNRKIVLSALLFCPVTVVLANIHPSTASYSTTKKVLSTFGNSAAPALMAERNDSHTAQGGYIDLGLGAEYGNVENLIDIYDGLVNDFTSSDGGSSNNSLSNSDDSFDLGISIDWEQAFETYPNLDERLDIIEKNVAISASVLSLIAVEGYAKVEASAEAAFVLNDDLYGGTLVFGSSISGNLQGFGLFEPIDFDKDIAREQLNTLAELNVDDPAQTLDLSGGIVLYYDPATNNIDMTIDNDSLLLIKSAQISQVSLSYSKKAYEFEYGNLFWGVKPTFSRVGLTNVATRIGDLTNVEDLFDEMSDSEYVYSNGVDFDLGLIWQANNYELGIAISNIVENEYEYPEIDRSRFESIDMNNRLDHQETYTMARQAKFEGTIYTDSRDWQLNFDIDANSIEDPMRSEYQWVSISGQYSSDSWWLPSARFGYSKNLKGSELEYISAGLTMFNILTLDVSTSLDKVTINETSLWQGANLRLGIQFDY